MGFHLRKPVSNFVSNFPRDSKFSPQASIRQRVSILVYFHPATEGKDPEAMPSRNVRGSILTNHQLKPQSLSEVLSRPCVPIVSEGDDGPIHPNRVHAKADDAAEERFKTRLHVKRRPKALPESTEKAETN
jgi:hypothetical protein